MTLVCPGCSTRYRLDESRIPVGLAQVRCRRCGHPIRVGVSESPAAASPPPAAPPAAAFRTALLADEPREFRDRIASVLGEVGFEVSVTDNGEEALLLAGSHRFDLILINAYLRRVPGTQVCQRIKGAPGLKGTPVLLIGSYLDGGGSFPAGPAALLGADGLLATTLTRQELANRLAPFAAGEGPAPFPNAPPAGNHPESEEGEIARLARIMISDIRIYHPEKFGRALRDGTFFEAFSEELTKGRELLDQRFGHLPHRVRLLASALRDTLLDVRARYRRGNNLENS